MIGQGLISDSPTCRVRCSTKTTHLQQLTDCPFLGSTSLTVICLFLHSVGVRRKGQSEHPRAEYLMTKLTSNVVSQIEVQVTILVDLIGLSSSHRVSTPSSGLFRSLDNDIHPTHGQVPFKVGQADGLETFASVGGTLDPLSVRGRMYDVVEQVVDDVKDGSRGTRRRYDGEEEESEGGQLGVERESGAHDGKMKLV
jgi:hypothetical protein